MKSRLTTLTILVAGMLTVSPPNAAFAELTFGQWAEDKGYTPPGPENWMCSAHHKGITNLDGISGYTNLRGLFLFHNQISSLDANQFQGLPNLQSLVLAYNQISSLKANQFQGLTNLRQLHLDGNSISSPNASQFQGLPNLQILSLSHNQISSLDADQFQGLTNLQELYLNNNRISSLDANLFQGLTNLKRLYLDDNQISSFNANSLRDLTDLQLLGLSSNKMSSLDLTGFEATALTSFLIDSNPIMEVILADTTLSQATLDTLMRGHDESDFTIGIAELAGITSVDFTSADMAAVDQFDEMFAMADLETLILTNAVFSDAIIADDYKEVWDLISALEGNQLDALTVNEQLYAAMQTNLDAWDAGANNVLTVVPEPSTLLLLTVASLALFLCRRKTASGK